MLFFDTSICLEVVKKKGNINRDDWRRLTKYIRHTYRCCVSWVTWKELLVRLSRGEDQYWEQNREPLRVLRWKRDAVLLEKPPIFTIKHVLGVDAAPKAELDGRPAIPLSEQISAVLDAILVARNKIELKEGVKLPRKNQIIVFDLDHFDLFESSTRLEYANLLQGLRDGIIIRSDSTGLSAWILHQCGLTPYTEHCEKLSSRLDAAYRYHFWLSDQAKNPNYDFHDKRHLGDWDDAQQLFYFCDRRIHMLTLDRNFVDRTEGSPQAPQVLLYSEFVNSLAS
ncbi:MAG: hypothetical protein HY236_04565 [Acidobacteria bacterium]|nr:hypothetical protein [Acidobacteriota bacterium]